MIPELVFFYLLTFSVAYSFHIHFKNAGIKWGATRFLSIAILSMISSFISFFFSFHLISKASVLISVPLFLLGFKRVRETLKEIQTSELIFLLSFVLFLVIRYMDPDIFGAEKFMDIGFINSILRNRFPPPDPWFSGGNLSFYYYLGYTIPAWLMSVSFLPSYISYNIALPFLFGSTAVIAWEVGRCLTGDFRKGLLTIFTVAFAGNLASLYYFIKIAGNGPDYLYYWYSSRVIPGTINEFPYFSFLHGDMHAHVIAIPVKLASIYLLLLWMERREIKIIPLISILLAFSISGNTWDFPGMIILLLLTLFITSRDKISAIHIISAISAGLLLAFPFLPETTGRSVGFVGEHTSVIPFLAIYLPFLFPLMIVGLKNTKAGFLFLLFSTPFAVYGYLTFPFIFLSLAGTIYVNRKIQPLVLTALSLLMISETVYIESHLNTVFKFYLFIWILLAVSLPYLIEEIKGELSRVEFRISGAFLGLMLMAMAVYAPYATYSKSLSSPAYTLDGMNFMHGISEGDYRAIKWLYSRDVEVLLEAPSKSYSYGGRFSSFTGFPGVIQWYNHEVLWRENPDEIIRRIEDVKKMYTSQDRNEVLKLMEKYGISHVVVGNVERSEYDINIDKMGFKKVFEYDGTVIYRTEV